MNQRLVHVKDQYLLVRGVQRLRQVDQLVLDGFEGHDCQVVLNDMQSLKRVIEVLPVQVLLLFLRLVCGGGLLGDLRHEVVQVDSLLCLLFILLLLVLLLQLLLLLSKFIVTAVSFQKLVSVHTGPAYLAH